MNIYEMKIALFYNNVFQRKLREAKILIAFI